ncbi:hypothetical protein B0H19DRAFT_20005 [Mycena capillaripes]|nr:hypothetical protein B0H19DRAFT_20005 [Mycena capillaripes]
MKYNRFTNSNYNNCIMEVIKTNENNKTVSKNSEHNTISVVSTILRERELVSVRRSAANAPRRISVIRV